MAFQWTDADAYPYREGGIFLGLSDKGHEVGISTERHLLTVAGAGSGKGATLIIPNLLRWRQAVVVIDPKGENATETAERRAAMGQTVGVIDPYRIANVPDELRLSINPLAMIDPNSLTAAADLEAFGDGLVRRFNPDHALWDNGSAAMLAGFGAYVVLTAPPEYRTMTSLRRLLMQSPDAMRELAGNMLTVEGCGGLARAAGVSVLSCLDRKDSLESDFLEGARRHTVWLDDPAFKPVFEGGHPFDLRALKAGNGSLYLCIPPDYLDVRGGFLRLFVRMALTAMGKQLAAQDGGKSGRCLFVLDEFYSLGKLEIIAKAAGLMRGYGVQLWPFLQDIGQLGELYDRHGQQAFFSNSDAQIFFGNTDPDTLGAVSDSLGNVEPHEIGEAPIARRTRAPTGASVKGIIGGSDDYTRIAGGIVGGSIGAAGSLLDAITDHANQKAANKYQAEAQRLGKPRVSPSEIRELVGKKEGDKIARAAIVFAKGGDVLKIRLAPYFDPMPRPAAAPPSPAPETEPDAAPSPNWAMILIGGAVFASGVLPMFMRDDIGGFGATIYVFTAICGAFLLIRGRFSRG